MKKYNINNNEYELIDNYKDGFDLKEATDKLTDYFADYDYIVGDWAYDKLRLKGFCEEGNKEYRPINNYKNKDDYLKNYCAFDCKYFILKRIKQNL